MSNKVRIAFLTLLAVAFTPMFLAAAESDSARQREIDRLFASYDRTNSPGCALLVIQNGQVVYRKGYGMANLEYGVPIKPDTIFHVASISKQFTAFAIHLLEADRKLTLDDDIRKYLPELHDFGRKITIQHLLSHTSGLRDQWSLLTLAGWRSEDVITEGDILSLVFRQKALNFEPGAEELYSNTGYTLLGVIVKRVSGKSLRAFCQERIFTPLGMTRTHFYDDNTEVVVDRAYSYAPQGSTGFSNVPLQYATVGATSLFTTVEDMVKWDQNFIDAKVGGSGVIAAMLRKGTLGTGKEVDYASGLVISEYRGLKTIEHGGADAGCRADYLRFPEQNVSIVLFSNLRSVDPGALARKAADIYLASDLKPLPAKAPAPALDSTKVDPKDYDIYAGDYLLHPDLLLTFIPRDGHLVMRATGRGEMEALPLSKTEFVLKGVGARLRFVLDKNGKPEQVILTEGSDTPAPRIERAVLDASKLAEYTGDYYSDELGVLYFISLREGKLLLRHAKGETALEPMRTDEFVTDSPIGTIHFTRDGSGGTIRGFTVDNGRVRNLSFERTRLPVAAGGIVRTPTAGAERFNFTKAEPGRRLVVRGGEGVIKIINHGPASIVVENSKNHMTLGAGTEAKLDQTGETVITMKPADSGEHTSGTLDLPKDSFMREEPVAERTN